MRLIQAGFFVALPLCLAVPIFESMQATPNDLKTRQYGGGGGSPEDEFYSGNRRWIPADQINGASRTSCPFLNTAANHGFL